MLSNFFYLVMYMRIIVLCGSSAFVIYTPISLYFMFHRLGICTAHLLRSNCIDVIVGVYFPFSNINYECTISVVFFF